MNQSSNDLQTIMENARDFSKDELLRLRQYIDALIVDADKVRTQEARPFQRLAQASDAWGFRSGYSDTSDRVDDLLTEYFEDRIELNGLIDSGFFMETERKAHCLWSLENKRITECE